MDKRVEPEDATQERQESVTDGIATPQVCALVMKDE
jgi:hypothetical protein